LRLAAAAKNAEDPLAPLPETLAGYDRHFCEAINRCLSVFPQDRLESAQAWRDMIDIERRQRMLLEKARNDKELVRRVAEIVSQSRKDMAEAEPEPEPAPSMPKHYGPRPVIPPAPPKRRRVADAAPPSDLHDLDDAPAAAREVQPACTPPPRPARPRKAAKPGRPERAAHAADPAAHRHASAAAEAPEATALETHEAMPARSAAPAPAPLREATAAGVSKLRRIIAATGRFYSVARKFDSFSAQEAMK
jgi:hypothetical protein